VVGFPLLITDKPGLIRHVRPGHRAESQPMERRRVRHQLSLGGRLDRQAKEARAQANEMPPCVERDQLLKKARQAETASKIDRWISSPGLQALKEIAELKK
jgi:hypothetical protein